MPSDPTAERRQTPAERNHEVIMALASRPATPPEHNLNLTRNAKQQVQIDLTVRGHDLQAVLDSAETAFDALCAKYPTVTGEGL